MACASAITCSSGMTSCVRKICSGPMGSMQLPSTNPALFAASMVFRRVSTLQRVNTPSPRRTTWYTPAMPMRTSSRA